MKKWLLLWTCLLLGTNSVSSPYSATFDSQGVIDIADTPSGLLIEINMRAEPHQKYMIKLLSHCENFSPYWVRFRHSFEVRITSDKDGRILRSTYFPGTHERDLKSRSLNTLAFYKLEKSYWKMLKCVVLEDIEMSHSNLSSYFHILENPLEDYCLFTVTRKTSNFPD